MSNGKSSILDRITRTCYDSGNKVIAVQHLVVKSATINTADGAGRNLVRTDSLSSHRFKRTASLHLEKTTISQNSSGSGVKQVSYVVTSGNFNEHTHEVDGDVGIVTYLGKPQENDISFNLEAVPGILVEGDSF